MVKTVNTPTGWNDKLNSIMEEWKTLSDKEKEDLLKMFQEDKMEGEKNSEIPQELRAYREAWKEKIKWLDDKTKNKIIKAAEKIPVKVETDSDGSKLVEFKLWNRTYKILNPKLKTHSDDKYQYNDGISDVVSLKGMWWDDVDKWENKKLKEYVKEKQSHWFHIPTVEEIMKIVQELRKSADLDFPWEKTAFSYEWREIAMLMYLTGMYWMYWLSMWTHEESNSQILQRYQWEANSRSLLICKDNGRWLSLKNLDTIDYSANLCMISCE